MMGGFGSGDWADVMTRKVNTGLCRTLSVKTLKQMGVFDVENTEDRFCVRWVNDYGEDAGQVTISRVVDGDGYIRALHLDSGGSVTVTASDIQIKSTPCFYGGVRYWLRCPAVVDGVLCEDRVGKLYLPPGGQVFGCRQCYDLTYESCQQSHKYDRVFDHLEGLDEANLTINQALRLGGL